MPWTWKTESSLAKFPLINGQFFEKNIREVRGSPSPHRIRERRYQSSLKSLHRDGQKSSRSTSGIPKQRQGQKGQSGSQSDWWGIRRIPKQGTQKIISQRCVFHIRLNISRTKHINLPKKTRLKKVDAPLLLLFRYMKGKKVRGSEMGPLSLKTPMHYYAHLACETGSIRSFLGANKKNWSSVCSCFNHCMWRTKLLTDWRKKKLQEIWLR